MIGSSVGRMDDDPDFCQYGTLGGFVQDRDDPDIKGFLTCCHVLFKYLPKTQMDVEESNLADEAIANIDNNEEFSEVQLLSPSNSAPCRSVIPEVGDEVAQPSVGDARDHGLGHEEVNCGIVLRRKFQNENINNQEQFIDAAFVRVTNRDISSAHLASMDHVARRNVRGLLRKGTELTFNSATAEGIDAVSLNRKHSTVYKCGCKSGLTSAEYRFDAANIRIKINDGEVIAKNVIAIEDSADDFGPFGTKGDSGSFVFYITPRGDIKVIGLFFAVNELGLTYYAIPIEHILDTMNLELCHFDD